MNDVFLRVPAKCHESGRVAVIFSSANSSAFTYYKTFIKYDYLSCIFIRDPYHGRWYQSGIGHGLDSWRDIICHLKNELNDIDPSGISFWGSSMGGYAALKAAFEFPGSACFVFSPQTVLNNKLPHNIKNSLYINPNSNISIVDQRFNAGNILIVLGAADLVDIYHYYAGGFSHNSVLPIFEGDHLVSASLHKSGFIDGCIEHWIHSCNASINHLVDKYSVTLDRDIYDRDFCKLIFDVVESYYINKDFDRCSSYLDALLTRKENSGLYMLKGHIFAHQSDLKNAELCFAKSLTLSASTLEPAKQFATILYKHLNFEKAISYFTLALSSRHNDYDSLCGLSECYALTDSTHSARECLFKAIAIRPSNSRAFKIASKFNIDISGADLGTDQNKS